MLSNKWSFPYCRDYDIEDYVSDCRRLFIQKSFACDLELLCSDGSLPFYQVCVLSLLVTYLSFPTVQCLLASHSEYMRNLLGRFQDLEFSVGDWQYGEMFLLDRRKSSRNLSLSVPDFTKDQLRLLLDFILNGFVSLNASDVKTLKEVWRVFKIDTVSLDMLDIISEVNLTDRSSTVSGMQEPSCGSSKLVNIKKEISEKMEDFLAFRSDLEVECGLCKERFQDELHLLRHMDYIHQSTDTNSMYDRIKYKRTRENESNSHPKNKGKGKGKGKKSSESRPVRKETQIPEAEMEALSDCNSVDDVLPPVSDEILMSDTEITFRNSEQKDDRIKSNEDSKSSTDSSDTVQTSHTVSKICLERKRKLSGDDEAEKTSGKKSRESEDCDSGGDNEVEAEDPSVSWGDITCVYCDESVPVMEDRPGQNRKKYQTHLLSHFLDSQYRDVPDGLRLYRCSYRDCSYSAASKNHYIQHIAFKHDEWFKRINIRIENLSRDPSIAEELEDLSSVKETFLTDDRIIVRKGSSKPLWVEGVTLGKKSDLENNSVSDSRPGSKLSKAVVKTNWCQSQQKPSEDERKSTDSERKSAEPERKSSELERKSAEPEKTSAEPERKPAEPELQEKKTKVYPILQCHLCTKIMKTDPEQILKNRHSYQVHLVEAHFERSMYGDIEDGEKYLCPRTNCTFPGTDLKNRIRYHLAIYHQEFQQRCVKRVKELESKSDQTSLEKNELNKIRNILVFFNEDSRVVDETIKSQLESLPAASQAEENKDEVRTLDIKKEKDMVEISEDFSKYLRAGSIKSEPIDIDHECDKEKQEKPKSDTTEPPKPTATDTMKRKKSKKDLKSENLRKKPTNYEAEEEIIKIEDDVENSGDKNSTENSLERQDIQKLDEVIVNSITIHDDENEEDQPKEETVKEQSPSHSKAEPEQSDNTQSTEYSCKACKERFKERPAVIMHIIGEHILDKFGEVPELVNGKFQCPHCSYSTDIRHGILAHLTLKHAAVNITDVTDFIVHHEKPSAEAPEEGDSAEAGDVKEEVAPALPVQINLDDNADITWKCKACKKSFTTEDLARQHVILDHLIDHFKVLAPIDKKIFVCNHCNRYSTVSRVSFIKHLGMNHQVVSEETFAEYIEQSRTLLLDIDVIKCRCDKKFDKQRQLREHIIFSHCKQTFRHIPKGRASYSCRDHYPNCSFTVESRFTFIKHLVSEHQILSEEEIKKYLPSSVEEDIVSLTDGSSLDRESLDNDRSTIGFDDSVSQAANQKGSDPAETLTVIELDEEPIQEETPFANNSGHSCPICFKLIAQRSNFEDHLETHGINNEAVFFCSDCDIATSFAQMYHHLSSYHKDNPSTEVKCLPCNEVFRQFSSQTCLKLLKDHCVNKVSRNHHKLKVAEYIRRPEETLHQLFR